MLQIKQLGICDYVDISQQMEAFTKQRDGNTEDECWLLQHYPVYTQGVNCQQLPKIEQTGINVVRSNRGGQMTYHAPGQLVVYCLLDLKKLGLGPRRLVEKCQHLIVEFLARYNIQGQMQQSFPGVYVDGKKIASLGFRISRGCCYHGFAINVDMDIKPFEWIDPCGCDWLEVTQLANYSDNVSIASANSEIIALLNHYFKP